MTPRVWYLYLSALIAGFASMMLELISARLFAPYFGAGLNTWTALIAATLLYLAIGYHRGGRKVDANPTISILLRPLFIAGFSILAFPFVYYFLTKIFPIPLAFLAIFLGYYCTPLLLSFLLLYYPVTRLGEIIPICIGLLAKESKGLGKIAGNIYAYSTLGGLAGTLLTGFVLIPLLPTPRLFIILAGIIIGISILGYSIHREKWAIKSTTIFLLVFFFTVGIIVDIDTVMAVYVIHPPPKLLKRTNSFYGSIDVMEFQDRRYLFIDRMLQTSMPLSDSFYQEKGTALKEQYFFELLPYFNPQAKTALVIGLGGGLINKIFQPYGITAEFIEIDPKVVNIARKYFNFNGQAYLDDGRHYLRLTKKKYDFIVIDAYSSDMLPFYLFTSEAFEDAKRCLTENGIIALNLISFPEKSRVTSSVWKTLHTEYPYTLAYRSNNQIRNLPQCLFFFASMKPMVQHWVGFTPEKTIEFDNLIKNYELEFADSQGVVLSDTYAPLDYSWNDIAQRWRLSSDLTDLNSIGMIFHNQYKIANLINRGQSMKKVHEDYKKIAYALALFSMDAGIYPTTEQELTVLIRREQPIGMMQSKNDYSYLDGDILNFYDPFSEDIASYRYACPQSKDSRVYWPFYMIVSNGPNRKPDLDEKSFQPYCKDTLGNLIPNAPNFGLSQPLLDYVYDPSNGTMSSGDIVYIGDAELLGLPKSLRQW